MALQTMRERVEMSKYKNKRMMVRAGNGRFRQATGADFGIGGACPVCRHLLLRHYDGDPNAEFIDPRLFRYRCFTCEPETEQEVEARKAKEEKERAKFTSFFTEIAERKQNSTRYKNRKDASCVFDAFEAAGLPTEKRMMHGILTADLIGLLESNGYKLFYKGDSVSVKKGCGFFVIRDFQKRFAHVEYHTSAVDVIDYAPETIGAVAIKVVQ